MRAQKIRTQSEQHTKYPKNIKKESKQKLKQKKLRRTF